MTMSYDVSFTEEAIEDLSFLTIYEAQYTFSTERAQARVDELMESISSSLSAFPARIPEKPYGNAADLSEGTTTGGGMI